MLESKNEKKVKCRNVATDRLSEKVMRLYSLELEDQHCKQSLNTHLVRQGVQCPLPRANRIYLAQRSELQGLGSASVA